MDYAEQLQTIDKILQKKANRNSAADTQVRIVSDKHGIDYRYESSGKRQYHGASIGKVFVAALLVDLAKDNKLKLDQKIVEILDLNDLKKLFVIDGKDYSPEVTVRQLAMHTSGINDYFESKSSNDSSFIELVTSRQDQSWTPDDLLNYTRTYQKPIGRPGEKFFYSDTGYVLLGKILEKVSGTSYGDLLSQVIFKPLGMNESYLYGNQKDSSGKAIAPLLVNGVDVSHAKSLSCDWAGGGVITTTDDLLLFQQALHAGNFGDILSQQKNFPNKFRPGMHYGFGLMELHFNEFFFLLRGLPRPKGHIGITATHMFYDDVNDVHYIMNFGSDNRMVESFKTFIKIVQTLKMKV